MNVEDIIEILAGLHKDYNIPLASSDYNLITSLGRQTFRGIGFTDRQLELAKTKIKDYLDQLLDAGIDPKEVSSTRLEVRMIDRSKWIQILDEDKIGVRFVFNKKYIEKIEALKKITGGDYVKENKTHVIPYSEKNLYDIINLFPQFEIQDELKEQYKELQEMSRNKKNYVPGIYGFKLSNFSDKAIETMISTIGEPDENTLPLYKDRSNMFGIEHFDQEDLEEALTSLSILSKKIIMRTETRVLINSKEYTLDNLFQSILELYRLPLLVILDEDKAYEQLVDVYSKLRYVFPSESQTVLFRKENNNSENQAFNNYIKDNNINCSLDKDPKVVYISNNKLPKPLVKSNWVPDAALYYNQLVGRGIVGTYTDELDLTICYSDDAISMWFNKGIEKL